MHHIYEAAHIVTSNLLFSYIIREFSQLLTINDALLLTLQDEDLVVVEVTGQLPSALLLANCRSKLEAWQTGTPLQDIHPSLSNYQQILRLYGEDGNLVGLLIYSGPFQPLTPELQVFADQAGYLLSINRAFESLNCWQETQSKLKYQISFFINTVNNIFEPYDNLTMVKLYMEIISEMFLFPKTIVYELQNEAFIPVASRGIKAADLPQMLLEAAPIISHPTLGMFPQRLNSLTPEHIGANNYQQLKNSQTNLLIPLQVNAKPRYIMSFQSPEDKCSNSQDWRIISALSQTFNRAIELNEVRQELMLTNQDLDKQIFSLTTVYQAAEKILAIADLEQTANMALDMLMEIFQSVTSTVFVHNIAEQRLELLTCKSVVGSQDLSYWLAMPDLPTRAVIDYTDPGQREEFLLSFPDFAGVEALLQPSVIVHLRQQDRYYGFITLSTRMTEQPYSPEDYALLSMLSHSIAIALDNAWMLARIQEQNQLLDRRLEDLLAIQDVLKIMRQATSMNEFCTLMENTLKLGVGAQLFALIIGNGQVLQTIVGPEKLIIENGKQIQSFTSAGIMKTADNNQVIVVPIQHPGRLNAYLVISEFTNTVLDDGQRIQLLDLIAAMLADTLAHLYEQHRINRQGVLDYSLLLCHYFQQELDQLTELGLETCMVKFHHTDPAQVINSLGYAAFGAILCPQTGILIGRLPEEQLILLLEPITKEYTVLPELTPNSIFG